MENHQVAWMNVRGGAAGGQDRLREGLDKPFMKSRPALSDIAHVRHVPGETRSEGTCPVFGHQRDGVGIEHRSPARARADDARLPDGLESDHRTAVTAANIAAVVTVGASSSGG